MSEIKHPAKIGLHSEVVKFIQECTNKLTENSFTRSEGERKESFVIRAFVWNCIHMLSLNQRFLNFISRAPVSVSHCYSRLIQPRNQIQMQNNNYMPLSCFPTICQYRASLENLSRPPV